MSDKPFQLTDEDRIAIRAAMDDIDWQQVEINKRLSLAERAQKAISMSTTTLRIAVYRLQQDHPELDRSEAQRIILQRYYASKTDGQPKTSRT